MRASVIAVLAALALCVGAVEAATLKVPSQYATIALAEAAASNGDTIAIFRGRYKENIVSFKSLNFFGVPGTIWDGNIGGVNGTQLNLFGTNVKIRNIEFQNGNNAVDITGANVKVVNCTFRGCGSAALTITGATATVSGCRFTGIGGQAADITGANATVTHNTIQHCNGGGIYINGANPLISNNVQDGVNGNGIQALSADNARILNNRLSNIEDDGINVTGNDVTVSNNRMTNLGPSCSYGIYISGDAATVSRNTMNGVVYYDDDAEGIYISGSGKHVVTYNRVFGVFGSDEGYAYGIEISGGTGVNVSHNVVDTVSAEDDAEGMDIWCPGGDATVSYNIVRRVTGTDDAWAEGEGIELFSDNATVTHNVVSSIHGDDETYGFYISGDNATVAFNRADHTEGDDAYGFYVSSDNATVNGNTAHDCAGYEYGIYVSGDDFTVTNNRVWNMGYSTDGIGVSGLAASGTALIQGNRVWDCQDNGFYLNVSGATIRRNTALRCGVSGSYAGFLITGDTNMVTRNSARAIGGDGFHVQGNTNTLYRNTASNCNKDGFDLSSGTGNTLDRCRASRCAGEGLDNGATGSVVTKNNLHRNRIDVANDGTIATFTGNSYTTGGTTTPQEVD